MTKLLLTQGVGYSTFSAGVWTDHVPNFWFSDDTTPTWVLKSNADMNDTFPDDPTQNGVAARWLSPVTDGNGTWIVYHTAIMGVVEEGDNPTDIALAVSVDDGATWDMHYIEHSYMDGDQMFYMSFATMYWDGTQFCASTTSERQSGTATSPDGIDWTFYDNDCVAIYQMERLGNGKYLGYGSAGAVFESHEFRARYWYATADTIEDGFTTLWDFESPADPGEFLLSSYGGYSQFKQKLFTTNGRYLVTVPLGSTQIMRANVGLADLNADTFAPTYIIIPDIGFAPQVTVWTGDQFWAIGSYSGTATGIPGLTGFQILGWATSVDGLTWTVHYDTDLYANQTDSFWDARYDGSSIWLTFGSQSKPFGLYQYDLSAATPMWVSHENPDDDYIIEDTWLNTGRATYQIMDDQNFFFKQMFAEGTLTLDSTADLEYQKRLTTHSPVTLGNNTPFLDDKALRTSTPVTLGGAVSHVSKFVDFSGTDGGLATNSNTRGMGLGGDHRVSFIDAGTQVVATDGSVVDLPTLNVDDYVVFVQNQAPLYHNCYPDDFGKVEITRFNDFEDGGYRFTMFHILDPTVTFHGLNAEGSIGETDTVVAWAVFADVSEFFFEYRDNTGQDPDLYAPQCSYHSATGQARVVRLIAWETENPGDVESLVVGGNETELGYLTGWIGSPWPAVGVGIWGSNDETPPTSTLDYSQADPTRGGRAVTLVLVNNELFPAGANSRRTRHNPSPVGSNRIPIEVPTP